MATSKVTSIFFFFFKDWDDIKGVKRFYVKQVKV